MLKGKWRSHQLMAKIFAYFAWVKEASETPKVTDLIHKLLQADLLPPILFPLLPVHLEMLKDLGISYLKHYEAMILFLRPNRFCSEEGIHSCGRSIHNPVSGQLCHEVARTNYFHYPSFPWPHGIHKLCCAFCQALDGFFTTSTLLFSQMTVATDVSQSLLWWTLLDNPPLCNALQTTISGDCIIYQCLPVGLGSSMWGEACPELLGWNGVDV